MSSKVAQGVGVSRSVPGKAERVVQLLEQEMVNGTFEPGQRFLSTHRISRMYDVSLGTARKALVELVERGYLEAAPRSGFFLRPDGAQLAGQNRMPATPPVATATRTILLVLVGETGHWGLHVLDRYLEALAQAAARYGWSVVRVANHPQEIAQALDGKHLAGCLAYGLKEAPAAPIDPASVVTWNSSGDWRDPSCSVMAIDAENAARLAYEYLWDLGHQRMALVRPLAWEYPPFISRGAVLGMRKTFTALGNRWSSDDVIHTTPDNLPGLYQRICDAGITGVFCEDWDGVVELYRQAHRAGEKIGDRLSLVAYGGNDMADIVSPRPARIYWRMIDYAARIVEAVHRREEDGLPMDRTLVVPVFLEPGLGAAIPNKSSVF